VSEGAAARRRKAHGLAKADRVLRYLGVPPTIPPPLKARGRAEQQIAEALVTITDGSRGAADALDEFQDASRNMARAVEGLNASVSRFRLGEPF
jgi:hypothetical protein